MNVTSDRLQRINDLIDRIVVDVRHCDRPTFESDRLLIDATAFRLMHVGENTKALGPAVRHRHGALPWRDMAAVRNLLAHDYDGIDPAILWRTARDHLGEVKAACLVEIIDGRNQGE